MRPFLVLLACLFALTFALGNRHQFSSIASRWNKEGQGSNDSDLNHSVSKQPWVIRGLGKYNDHDVERAQRIIQQHLRVGARIAPAQAPTESCYQSNGKFLEASTCLDQMRMSGERTIYITRQKIQDGETALRGFTRMHGHVVVVKSNAHFRHTILHEIGHTYGLAHCTDKRCLMAIHNDSEETGRFCNRCIKLLPKEEFVDLKSLAMQSE